MYTCEMLGSGLERSIPSFLVCSLLTAQKQQVSVVNGEYTSSWMAKVWVIAVRVLACGARLVVDGLPARAVGLYRW